MIPKQSLQSGKNKRITSHERATVLLAFITGLITGFAILSLAFGGNIVEIALKILLFISALGFGTITIYALTRLDSLLKEQEPEN